MKRIISIQDISCIGKCSLTVALPIISAAGVETAIVPTAVLSTHTQFKDFTFCDLTKEMNGIKSHWKKEGFSFDAIMSGYLGSKDQIDIVSEYIDTFRNKTTKVIIDPVMADNGKLYAGFSADFPSHMAELCKKADVILPNISEACIMLDEPYPGEEADESTIRSLLLKLSRLGTPTCIITGAILPDNKIGFIGYNKEENEFFSYGTDRVPFRSHGTGDIFAASFVGALMNDISTFDALKIGAEYTRACIQNTYMDQNRIKYGVNFELEIPYYLKLLKRI